MLVTSPVAVEKLFSQKIAKIKLRQDALGSIFSGRVDIFYPPNRRCLWLRRSFSTATGYFNSLESDCVTRGSMDLNERIRSDLACRARKLGGRLQATLERLRLWLLAWEQRVDFWPTFKGTLTAHEWTIYPFFLLLVVIFFLLLPRACRYP